MSISLNELTYRTFNIIRPQLSDDESIDISEIQYDVENARALLIKRNYGKKFKTQLPESIIQTVPKLEIESVNASNVYQEIPSGNVLMKTKLKIPQLLEKSSGMPMVKRISASTILSSNFTIVTPQQSIYSGNGKFNSKNIFCFYENDYLYFITKRTLFKGVKYIDLYAVFAKPTDVNAFKNTNYSTDSSNVLYDANLPYNNESAYPIGQEWEFDLAKIILKDKLGIEISQPIDDINDSSDTLRQIKTR